MAIFTKRLTSNNSDGVGYNDGQWRLNPWDVFLGFSNGCTLIGYFCFPLVTIPKNSTIINAKITLKAMNTESTTG